MSLFDLLACPVTGETLIPDGDALVTPSGRRYRVQDGVPILTPVADQEITHEHPVTVRKDFEPTIQFVVDSLPKDRRILDLGSGNRDTDDPRVVRMDPMLSPYVDIVGDAHQLPFQDESLDMVYATAVFEHLHHPFEAAREIWRVLRPGGYALVDCNFVFPFHGYPAVYFNASTEGMRQLFEDFRELIVVVPPWQGPSFGIDAILSEYLQAFHPRTPEQHEFAAALRAIREYPLLEYDALLDPAGAERIAAGVTYFGVKQPSEGDSLYPACVLDAWRRREDLQARFPDPALLLDMTTPSPDNLFRWAMSPDADAEAGIVAWRDAVVPWHRSGETT